jgi:hypothetical protein
MCASLRFNLYLPLPLSTPDTNGFSHVESQLLPGTSPVLSDATGMNGVEFQLLATFTFLAFVTHKSP